MDAYHNALYNAVGIIPLNSEPGLRNGKTDFFVSLRSEYTGTPTKYLVARYMFFYNNIRIDENGEIKVEKLTGKKRN